MVYTPFKGVDVPGPKREFAGYGRNVPKVCWPQDARVAVNTALNYEEGPNTAIRTATGATTVRPR